MASREGQRPEQTPPVAAAPGSPQSCSPLPCPPRRGTIRLVARSGGASGDSRRHNGEAETMSRRPILAWAGALLLAGGAAADDTTKRPTADDVARAEKAVKQ